MDRRGIIKQGICALTLIELLIAISISSILGLAVVMMLKNGLDAYTYSEEQALIFKVLDETLEEVSGEGFGSYGIKDALEIISAEEDRISFSCLWLDDSKRVSGEKKAYALNRPFKLGSSIPLVEYKAPAKETFETAPIIFIARPKGEEGKEKDRIVLGKALPAGSQLKIFFEPDHNRNPDVIMTIKWDKEKAAFVRGYMNRKEVVPKVQFKGLRLTNARLRYFDNSNNELPAPVPSELLNVVTAIKLTLQLEPQSEKGKIYEASALVNLRNSRTFGRGVTLREGLRMKIPDSAHIRAFGLGNIFGVEAGDMIQLLAQPKSGEAWRIKIFLNIKNNTPLIESYTIEYPPGIPVFSEKIDLTLDLPLNFLTIGSNGRYDYDLDKDIANVVQLTGNVILIVEKMTCQGAGIFIRP